MKQFTFIINIVYNKYIKHFIKIIISTNYIIYNRCSNKYGSYKMYLVWKNTHLKNQDI